MTVKELIEELSKLSPDKKVLMAGDYYCRFVKSLKEAKQYVFLTDEIEYLEGELEEDLEQQINDEL